MLPPWDDDNVDSEEERFSVPFAGRAKMPISYVTLELPSCTTRSPHRSVSGKDACAKNCADEEMTRPTTEDASGWLGDCCECDWCAFSESDTKGTMPQ